MNNFDVIRQDGRLLYEYIRGSHLYGLNNEDVRNHKFEYEEIIEMLECDKERMNQLMEQSTIREKIDTDFVNDLMIEIRKQQFGM